MSMHDDGAAYPSQHHTLWLAGQRTHQSTAAAPAAAAASKRQAAGGSSSEGRRASRAAPHIVVHKKKGMNERSFIRNDVGCLFIMMNDAR